MQAVMAALHVNTSALGPPPPLPPPPRLLTESRGPLASAVGATTPPLPSLLIRWRPLLGGPPPAVVWGPERGARRGLWLAEGGDSERRAGESEEPLTGCCRRAGRIVLRSASAFSVSPDLSVQKMHEEWRRTPSWRENQTRSRRFAKNKRAEICYVQLIGMLRVRIVQPRSAGTECAGATPDKIASG